jgi:hypothetical protein
LVVSYLGLKKPVLVAFRELINRVNRMPFSPISREEMLAKHMDDYFWYVHDLSVDPPMVIANPFVDDMEELTYIFQEEEDARLFAHLLSKTQLIKTIG